MNSGISIVYVFKYLILSIVSLCQLYLRKCRIYLCTFVNREWLIIQNILADFRSNATRNALTFINAKL